MSNAEQSFGDWRTEHQHRAQAHAWHYAEQATAESEQAMEYKDAAEDDRHADTTWLRDLRASHRRMAERHGARSSEALRLAEMWARVSGALVNGEQPLLATLEVHESQSLG